MKKVEMEVVDITMSGSSSGAYAMILGEVGGKYRLPIIIGATEAQAIAIELEKMKASRPLTHDLMRNVMRSCLIDLKEVTIYKMVEGVFYTNMLIEKGGEQEKIDARPSDAVALAYRFNSPIYCSTSVLDASGIVVEDGGDELFDEVSGDAATVEAATEEVAEEIQVSLEERRLELQRELDAAIALEEYEKAGQLRDAIEKLKGDADDA
jgi:uncharacterized protein